MKLAQNRLCRPCFKQDKPMREILQAQKSIKREFKVDRILKKIKALEGLVQENFMLQDS